MGAELVFVIVSYDIADDKRRRHVAKRMEDYGKRVQYSVFDCLLSEKEIRDLQYTLEHIINFEEDSVRFYRMCRKCESTIDVMGKGTVQEEQTFLIL